MSFLVSVIFFWEITIWNPGQTASDRIYLYIWQLLTTSSCRLLGQRHSPTETSSPLVTGSSWHLFSWLHLHSEETPQGFQEDIQSCGFQPALQGHTNDPQGKRSWSMEKWMEQAHLHLLTQMQTKFMEMSKSTERYPRLCLASFLL